MVIEAGESSEGPVVTHVEAGLISESSQRDGEGIDGEFCVC